MPIYRLILAALALLALNACTATSQALGPATSPGTTSQISVTSRALPLHAHSNGWACDAGYYPSGDSCVVLPEHASRDLSASAGASGVMPPSHPVAVPANASLDYLGSGWNCNRGYSRSGDSCQPVAVPANASLDYLGSGWNCDRGYSRSGDSCQPVAVPANASLDYLGSGWNCDRGYSRSGDSCQPVAVPANASLDYLGSGWNCDRGYSRSGDSCQPVAVPANASLDYLGSGWNCDRGYSRSGDSCQPVAVPANASLDYLGSGWNCDSGYESNGTGCVRVSSTPSNATVGGGYPCAENGSCYGDISNITGLPKTIQVNGYFRNDGTYVRGYYRSHR